MAPNTHICIHEDQFIGQSRAIERLDAELGYKKQRLDELKEDNKRMEEKIDDIKESVNEIIRASERDDNKLKDIINEQDNRITALESTNKTLKWVIGVELTGLSVCIALVGLLLSHILNFI